MSKQSGKLKKMWAGDRMRLLLVANMLEHLAGQLSGEDEELTVFANEMAALADKMIKLHSQSRSLEVPPTQIPD